MKTKITYTILIIILILVILSLCFIYYFKDKEAIININNNNNSEKGIKENARENQSNKNSVNIQIPETNKTPSKRKFTIIYESQNTNCASSIEYYYEDANYKYYFTCIKSGSIFIIINGIKYNIKEALNNKIVTIAELEEAGFYPLKEEKNTQKH